MKKLYPLVLFILAATVTMAQSNKQVKWTFSAKKIADKTYEIHMTAAIGNGYHMYSQMPGADGPLPTSFKFIPNPLTAMDEKVKENGKLVKKYESAWSSDVRYYEKSVDFIQVVKLKSNVKTNLDGSVEFIMCNESQCLPPSTVDFKVAIGG